MDILRFIKDKDIDEAFLIGGAGTGKTTKIEVYVTTLISNKIPFKIVTYTNKAKQVIEDKLPNLDDDYISTLHSFLKKRPTSNRFAKSLNNLLVSKQYGEPEFVKLLIVDEFSFVGMRDYLSIREMQDIAYIYKCEECGKELETDDRCTECNSTKVILQESDATRLKVLYVGDLNQGEPVKDTIPDWDIGNKYTKVLTKVWRQQSELGEVVNRFKERLDNRKYDIKLTFNNSCIKTDTLLQDYKDDTTDSKIVLAYTNKEVQEANAFIQGRVLPEVGDIVYNNSMKMNMTILSIEEATYKNMKHKTIIAPNNTKLLYDTKYNPMKTIANFKYIYLVNTNMGYYLILFGSEFSRLYREELANKLVELNKAGKDSKLAYKNHITLNDYVCDVDFTHCTTVHKSQGREFDTVYFNTYGLLNKNKNIVQKAKLFYVAISRAKNKLILN